MTALTVELSGQVQQALNRIPREMERDVKLYFGAEIPGGWADNVPGTGRQAPGRPAIHWPVPGT